MPRSTSFLIVSVGIRTLLGMKEIRRGRKYVRKGEERKIEKKGKSEKVRIYKGKKGNSDEGKRKCHYCTIIIL